MKIVGFYSSLQSLEMMIKPDTPYNNQGEGPIATVATCADLAAVSADCARRCIDRPMVHGGQHSMGTCGRLVLAVLSRCDRLRPHSLTINLLFSFFSHFSNIQTIHFSFHRCLVPHNPSIHPARRVVGVTTRRRRTRQWHGRVPLVDHQYRFGASTHGRCCAIEQWHLRQQRRPIVPVVL